MRVMKIGTFHQHRFPLKSNTLDLLTEKKMDYPISDGKLLNQRKFGDNTKNFGVLWFILFCSLFDSITSITSDVFYFNELG